MLKTRIQICIIDSISYLFAIKEKRLKTDYRINTVSDRFHPYRQHRRQQGTSLPQRRPQMLHGKGRQEKKVQARTTPKYTTSSDEGSSSDDEDNLFSLFANLNMQQKEKLNE
jgi:hypothetical protein